MQSKSVKCFQQHQWPGVKTIDFKSIAV